MTHELKMLADRPFTKATGGPVRVVYIAGVGRSGSTVLDSVLGNHPLIQSVGELSRLGNDAWIQNLYCSCGRQSSDCPFWTSVRQEWCSEEGAISVEEYIKVQSEIERFRLSPFVFGDNWRNTETFQTYEEQTVRLLRAIQSVSGSAASVDSSKAVDRAYALSMMPDVDLKVIQLVRDPRGVVWSHKKAFSRDLQNGLPRDIDPHPAWRAALYWDRMNLQAEWLRRRLGPRRALLVRYEDFMLNTIPVLQTIGAFIGINLDNVQRMIEAGEKLHFDHTIAGNRVRMKGELKLKYDQDWQQMLSPRDRQVTGLLSGWLMQRYGYKP